MHYSYYYYGHNTVFGYEGNKYFIIIIYNNNSYISYI